MSTRLLQTCCRIALQTSLQPKFSCRKSLECCGLARRTHTYFAAASLAAAPLALAAPLPAVSLAAAVLAIAVALAAASLAERVAIKPSARPASVH